jgi:hypothetical protein
VDEGERETGVSSPAVSFNGINRLRVTGMPVDALLGIGSWDKKLFSLSLMDTISLAWFVFIPRENA